MRKGLKVGLALGGGAARGLAHIGVLSALESRGIPIDYLAGVSVGSIIAAGYAAGLSCEQLAAAASSVTWKDLGGWSFSMRGFNRNKRMEDWLADILPCSTFEELQRPLRVMATDLHSGESVILEKGDLFTAIRASCAIPGLYVPLEVDGRLLADGYLTCNLPIRETRTMGADVVLASAIGLEVSPNIRLRNIYQILLRSFSIMSASVQKERFRDADVVFRPRVENYNWADIGAATELVQAGRESVERKMEDLEQALNPSFWTRVNWNPWRRSSDED